MVSEDSFLTFLGLVGGAVEFGLVGGASKEQFLNGGSVLWPIHEGGLNECCLSCSWLGSLPDPPLTWDGLIWVSCGLWPSVITSSDTPSDTCFEFWNWVLVAKGNGVTSFKSDWLSVWEEGSRSVSAKKSVEKGILDINIVCLVTVIV